MTAIDAERVSEARTGPAEISVVTRLRAAHTLHYALAFGILLAIKLSGVLQQSAGVLAEPPGHGSLALHAAVR